MDLCLVEGMMSLKQGNLILSHHLEFFLDNQDMER